MKPTKAHLLLTYVICLLFPSVSFATGGPRVGDEHLIRLDEAFRIGECYGPRIWPGFTAEETPVLLIDGEHEFLINMEQPLDGFTESTQHFRNRPVFVRPRTLPTRLLASFPIMGQEMAVVGTAEATEHSPAIWTILLLHEVFHVHQSTLVTYEKVNSLEISNDDTGQWQLDYPFPYEDARVTRAMHVVGHELFQLIQTKDEIESRTEISAEALASLLDLIALAFPDTKNREYLKFVVTKEGVARYFEYRVAQMAADHEPSIRFASNEGRDAFSAAWTDHYESMPFQIKHLGRVSRSRLEFYNLGLGLTLALDKVAPGWKDDYSKPDLWLDDMFLAASKEHSCHAADQ